MPAPETGARSIAAGDAGVWVLGQENAMVEIDPRTNRLVRPIEVGPRPAERTIDVGAVAEFVAFGDGMAWVANWNDGTGSRIDPATNTVTARIPVGATQALAAGAGSAWASVAGGTRDGALPASACGEVASGGRTPDVVVASDMPLQGPGATAPRALASVVRFVIQDHGLRAGKHVVGYQSCDDSTAQTGNFDRRRCAGERPCVRERGPARGRHRPIPVGLRADRVPDRQPRRRRPPARSPGTRSSRFRLQRQVGQ